MTEYIIKDNSGNYAVILPEKGATVTQFVSNEENVFYQDMENLKSTERPRCGIPFLFPVFGRTPEDSIYPMEIHGFGHTSVWTVLSHAEDTLKLELVSNEDTKKGYPFEFRVELMFSLKEGRLVIHQTYENKDVKDMPYAFGFHPYFAVNPTETEVNVDAELEMDMLTGQAKPFDKRPIKLVFPEGAPETGAFFLQVKKEAILHVAEKEIHMEFDDSFNRLVFWTVAGKEFLCVEPINSSPNGLMTGDCYILASGEKKEATISFYTK